MRIDNQFTVPADLERAWEFLTDLPRVTPCLPGASVDAVNGETLVGKVAIRIGPMNLTYAGEAKFVVKDDLNKIATIEASGRDGRGGGAVRAKIKASIAAVPEGTQVNLSTDLDITGRVAQLGRGPINEVSAKVMEQFAGCLATTIASDTAPESGAGETARTPGATPTAQPINLLDSSVVPARVRGAVAAIAGVLVLLAVRRLVRHRRRADA